MNSYGHIISAIMKIGDVMYIYFHCIEKGFNELTNIIESINNDRDNYEKYVDDLIYHIGNIVHWISVAHEIMPTKKSNLIDDEKGKLSGIRAIHDQQKHNLNFIEFQNMQQSNFFAFPVDFSNLSFDTRAVIWKHIDFPKAPNWWNTTRKSKYNEKIENYKKYLENKQVWCVFQETIIALKKGL